MSTALLHKTLKVNNKTVMALQKGIRAKRKGKHFFKVVKKRS